MAERETTVHDQAWFDEAFRVIRTAPLAQAEVELRGLIRDVSTAAMGRAMRAWLKTAAHRRVDAQKETPPARSRRRSPAPRCDETWPQDLAVTRQ